MGIISITADDAHIIFYKVFVSNAVGPQNMHLQRTRVIILFFLVQKSPTPFTHVSQYKYIF